ncbi:MAG: hypothetical protein KGI50_00470 [Patescibacteria group bacterium]|nr:hypothetical protein [Patescibacteria group bacterium]MDE2438170.1 hypothetical protein [Patescibacteria group bacterium]
MEEERFRKAQTNYIRAHSRFVRLDRMSNPPKEKVDRAEDDLRTASDAWKALQDGEGKKDN